MSWSVEHILGRTSRIGFRIVSHCKIMNSARALRTLRSLGRFEYIGMTRDIVATIFNEFNKIRHSLTCRIDAGHIRRLRFILAVSCNERLKTKKGVRLVYIFLDGKAGDETQSK